MKTISCNSQGAEISILNDVSGIVKPSRLVNMLYAYVALKHEVT